MYIRRKNVVYTRKNVVYTRKNVVLLLDKNKKIVYINKNEGYVVKMLHSILCFLSFFYMVNEKYTIFTIESDIILS